MKNIFKKMMLIVVIVLMTVTMIPVAFAAECEEHDLSLDGDIKTPVSCKTCETAIYSSDSDWYVGNYENVRTGNIARMAGNAIPSDTVTAYYVTKTVDGASCKLTFDWAINQGYTYYGRFRLHFYHNDTEVIARSFITTANPYKNILAETYEYTASGEVQVFKFVFEKVSNGGWADGGRTVYLDNINNHCDHALAAKICTSPECPTCGLVNDTTFSHAWDALTGGCTLCDATCSHESFTDGVCDECEYNCPHEEYTDGKCDLCEYPCPHDGHTVESCATCGSTEPHNWENNDGLCAGGCGATCEHPNFTDTVCNKCGYTCPHEKYTEGICDLCDYACPHDGHTKECCLICGSTEPHNWENEDGECADGCGFSCEHNYMAGICTVCSYKCLHPAESLTWELWVPATCIDGSEKATCDVCGVNKVFLLDKETYPESAHNYADDTDYTWHFTVETAEKLILTFSAETRVEKNWDGIYIYDYQKKLLGTYTDTELAGKVIELNGNGFYIRLDTDSTINYYGFSFDSIVAYIASDALTRVIPAVEGYAHDWSNIDGICARGCGTECEHESYSNDTCDECGIHEPPEVDANGYYLLENAGDLYWFAEVVNGGNKTANAKLMADIDLNNAVWKVIAETGLYYSKYGDDMGFAGIFDGNGHVIKNFKLESSTSRDASVGLFGTVSGTVKNLGVENVTFTDKGYDFRAGAIVGQLVTANGLIENCYAKNVSINPTEHVTGGIAGCTYEGTIRNCFVVDSVVSGTASRTGVIVGDTRADGSETDRKGTLSNCYADSTPLYSERVGTIENCEIKTDAQFASGEVAYLLNGNISEGIWKQTIGEDAHPVFDGDVVYFGYLSCADDAVAVYTNDSEASAEKLTHDIVTDVYQAPTCTATGLAEGEHCSRCDDATVPQEVIPELGHDIITDAYRAPTCTATGLTKGEHCSRCKDATVPQEIIPELGHDMITDAYKAPTCTATGLTEGEHCSRCNDMTVVQNVIPSLGHSFTKYEVVTAPTCGVAGEEVAVCDNGCKETYSREIAALTHSFTEYTYNEDADCEHDGTKTAKCDNDCGIEDTVTAEGTKFGHIDDDRDEYCENCGEKIRCSFCGEIHRNLLEDIICLILEFFHLVAQAFRISG